MEPTQNTPLRLRVQGFVSRVFNTTRINGIKRERYVSETVNSLKEADELIEKYRQRWDTVELNISEARPLPRRRREPSCRRVRVATS